VKRILLSLSLAMVLLLGVTVHGTSGLFTDAEQASGTVGTAIDFTCDDPCDFPCDDPCGNHCITFVSHSDSTWTYEVISGCSPALSHWVLEWCDCEAVVAVYENGELLDEDEWECGCFPQHTDLCGIKFENGYDDGEVRTVSIILDGDYPEGTVYFGTKAAHEIAICQVTGPVCDTFDFNSSGGTEEVDNCPDDPDKTEPGDCGCGVPDTDSDGDGIADCLDNCPDDPDKIEPGDCSCGVPDTDSDGDGIADCPDNCPDDPDKTGPGDCGCGVPDTDSDGDGIADCLDNCPYVFNPNQEDADGDGVGDVCNAN